MGTSYDNIKLPIAPMPSLVFSKICCFTGSLTRHRYSISFDRAEIRDVSVCTSKVVNPDDDSAAVLLIGLRRGIGATSIQKIQDIRTV